MVLEKPDIILVESMSDINSKALIFSVEGDGKVRITPEKQVIGFSIKNIQLYSCVFNPERRKETLIQVLRPCTLSVAGSCQTGQQPNLDVILSDVRIAVTPGIINIFTNTMAALGSGMGEKEEGMSKSFFFVSIFLNVLILIC
jgi:vacuolar protein sorting-associated protein 13A/C